MKKKSKEELQEAFANSQAFQELAKQKAL